MLTSQAEDSLRLFFFSAKSKSPPNLRFLKHTQHALERAQNTARERLFKLTIIRDEPLSR